MSGLTRGLLRIVTTRWWDAWFQAFASNKNRLWMGGTASRVATQMNSSGFCSLDIDGRGNSDFQSDVGDDVHPSPYQQVLAYETNLAALRQHRRCAFEYFPCTFPGTSCRSGSARSSGNNAMRTREEGGGRRVSEGEGDKRGVARCGVVLVVERRLLVSASSTVLACVRVHIPSERLKPYLENGGV